MIVNMFAIVATINKIITKVPSLQHGKRNCPPINLTGIGYGKVYLLSKKYTKNPAHQLIHFKLIHKAYATPYVLHRTKHLPTPLCTLCNSNTVGTYMHMFFDCPIISTFRDTVFLMVSELCDRFIPKHPNICLLNDDSELNLNVYQRRILHTALTAAKKVIKKMWYEPTFPADKMCPIELKNIALLECSTARMNRVKPWTIKAW